MIWNPCNKAVLITDSSVSKGLSCPVLLHSLSLVLILLWHLKFALLLTTAAFWDLHYAFDGVHFHSTLIHDAVSLCLFHETTLLDFVVSLSPLTLFQSEFLPVEDAFW